MTEEIDWCPSPPSRCCLLAVFDIQMQVYHQSQAKLLGKVSLVSSEVGSFRSEVGSTRFSKESNAVRAVLGCDRWIPRGLDRLAGYVQVLAYHDAAQLRPSSNHHRLSLC